MQSSSCGNDRVESLSVNVSDAYIVHVKHMEIIGELLSMFCCIDGPKSGVTLPTIASSDVMS
jgi:hypothetical protein